MEMQELEGAMAVGGGGARALPAAARAEDRWPVQDPRRAPEGHPAWNTQSLSAAS